MRAFDLHARNTHIKQLQKLHAAKKSHHLELMLVLLGPRVLFIVPNQTLNINVLLRGRHFML